MRTKVMMVTAGAMLLGGCVAPLAAGLATGAGLFGVNEATEGLTRSEAYSDDRVRNMAATSLGVSSDDLLISNKAWRNDVLHWITTHRDGRRFKCETAFGNATCTPLLP